MTSSFEISPIAPAEYDEKFTTVIQMQYSIQLINGKLEYVFEYRLMTKFPSGSAPFPAALSKAFSTASLPAAHDGWIPFFVGDRAVGPPIDIHVKDGDALIVIETVPNGSFSELYWSITRSAIKTEQNRQELYGDLLYSDGKTWETLREFTNNKKTNPRLICFKAKLNGDLSNRVHKFSYNVYLKNQQQTMEEHEIDPEIKNPST